MGEKAAAATAASLKPDLQVRSSAKRASIVATLCSTTGTFWSLGIDRNGTGISNHMIIQNHTGANIRFHQHYVNWGYAGMAPDADLPSQYEDDCFFHAAGGWCATGSSGIVTYQLDDETYLHILWSCPYNFNHFCNFVGLYLCGAREKRPTYTLFNSMLQDVTDPGIFPRRYSPYDLVCCGPGVISFSPTGKVNWGNHRPCEVQMDNFSVSVTMGDSHKASSIVSICKMQPHSKMAASVPMCENNLKLPD